jgi:hypothetical protein
MILHDLLLVERVVNLFTPDQKARHAAEVWDILQKSYAKMDGFKSAASPEELIHDSGLWKLVTRDGKITALNIYKDKFGRKSIASGTDGSPQGRRDYMMVKDEDIKLRRTWAEVSGPAERILQKSGGKPLPAHWAALLTGKKILAINDDGVHYTRLISGHPHEKIIYGFVNLTPEEARSFAANGVDMNDLPDQVTVKGGHANGRR